MNAAIFPKPTHWEHRASDCTTHGNASAMRRERHADGPWLCVACAEFAAQIPNVRVSTDAEQTAVGNPLRPADASSGPSQTDAGGDVGAFFGALPADGQSDAQALAELRAHDHAHCGVCTAPLLAAVERLCAALRGEGDTRAALKGLELEAGTAAQRWKP